MHNKLCAQVLLNTLAERGWTQTVLAKRARLSFSVVSDHISGKRAIRDEHLAAYLHALGSHERPILLAAWLRDHLCADVQHDVLKERDNRVADRVAQWAPKLTAEHSSMLHWWAYVIERDPECRVIFEMVTRKSGFPQHWC